MQPLPGNWKIRRRFMFVIIAFCMAVICYCLWHDTNTEVAQSAVSMAFVIIGTTVASYVFGAAWQDINNPWQEKERNDYWGGGGFYGRRSVYGMPVDDEDEK